MNDLSRRRQLEKQEEVRNTILEVARSIISQEGVQGLSIRKITSELDYSPAIVYHYFKNKSEIIESIVSEGYGRIIAAARAVKINDTHPEKELKEMFTNYMRAALDSPEEYKAIMLNPDPSILKRTALLERGISEKSPTMQLLGSNIQRGIDAGKYQACDPELTAQIIWTSTFGLLIKLMLESEVSSDQVERLIERHLEVVLNGIILRKEGETIS